MAIQDIKRWHWAAIGLALGLAFGASRVVWRVDFAQGIGPVLSQREFERELIARTEDGTPRLTQMVIHPPDADGRCWIVGGRVVASAQGERTELFRFAAAELYRPLEPSGGNSPLSVRGYLRQVKTQHPELHFTYHYAWWEQTWCTLSLGVVGGFLTVGIIWPMLLRMMIGAGLAGSEEEPAYDLDRFTQSPAASKPAGEAERVQQSDQLSEYVETMVKSQAPEPAPAAVEEEVAKQANDAKITPVLNGGPLDALQVAPESPKDYQGEYYPVARTAAADRRQVSAQVNGAGRQTER